MHLSNIDKARTLAKTFAELGGAMKTLRAGVSPYMNFHGGPLIDMRPEEAEAIIKTRYAELKDAADEIGLELPELPA